MPEADSSDCARSSRSAYLPFVDGLRALAVLAVLAHHLDPLGLPGGFTGVDVFFVISGFVVSASVAAAPHASLGAFAAWFYARRLRRIAPALVACLLVTGLASAVLIPPVWLSEGSQRTGLMAFIGLSNIVLWRNGADYFAPAADFNPYAHTWSLGVEEQFYLLFPLLFLPWLRGRRGLALGVLALLVAASLACAVWLHASGRAAAGFYLIPARFWQIGAGVLLYQCLAWRRADAVPTERPSHVAWLPALAFALLLAGLVLPRAGHVPWPDGLLPVLATVALIALLVRDPGVSPVHRLLVAAPLRAIGRGSYSLYLWHWPVFVLMRWTVGLDTPLQAIVALAVSAGLAWLSYRWVEQPFRRGARWRAVPPLRVLLPGLVLLLGFGLGFRAIDRASPQLSLSAVAREAERWLPDRARPGLQGCGPQRTRESLGGIEVWRFDATHCRQAPRAAMRLFVLGDSHALAYVAALRTLALEGFEVRLYQRPGCPVIGLVDAREFEDAACREAIDTALTDIGARARAGDALLLASLRVPHLSSPWAPLRDLATAQAAVDSADAASVRRRSEVWAATALAPLAQDGVRVILEAPKPVLPAPPFRCVDAFNRSNSDCAGGLELDEAAFEALRAPALGTLERIAAALPGAQVWDSAPYLCDGGSCGAFWRGEPSFVDGDHLSAAATLRLLPDLRRLLQAREPEKPGRARP